MRLLILKCIKSIRWVCNNTIFGLILGMKKLLHVGCGPQNKNGLKGFSSSDWEEIRFDIDPKVNPDIQGTLTDMTLVGSESRRRYFLLP